VWARDAARAGLRRTAAGLGLESEHSAGKGKALTGGIRLPARGGGKGEGGAGSLSRGGREQAGPRGKKGKKRPGQLGWLGCAGKREKRRKKRRESGPGPKKKRERRKNEMLSIAFEV
jgi:hypothetical protein